MRLIKPILFLKKSALEYFLALKRTPYNLLTIKRPCNYPLCGDLSCTTKPLIKKS